MKKSLYFSQIIALLLIAIGLHSCSAIRHTTTTTTHDTTAVHDTLLQVKTNTITETRHDTVIVTAATTVVDTFKASDFTEPTTQGGHKVPRTFTRHSNNVTSTVTVDTAGNIIVTCKADSLLTVIRNLESRIQTITDSASNHLASSTAKTSVTSDTTTIHSPTLWGRAKWWVVGIVAFLVLEALYRIFIKK